MLRSSKTREDAKKYLMTGKNKNVEIKDKKLLKIAQTFSFTEKQADAILDMRLYRLIGLEINDLNNEYKNTLSKIKEYKSILKDKEKANKIIIDDVLRIKKEYGKPRRTQIEDIDEIVIEEEKPIAQDVIYAQDKFGYAKTIDVSLYEKNKEIVETENQYVFDCSTEDRVIIFGSSGNMYQIKVDKVPLKKIKDKGKPIDNMSKFQSSTENIVGVYTDKGILDAYLFFVTKNGMIKLVDTIEYQTSNSKVVATKLNNDDEVIKVLLCYADKDIVIRTNDNYFLRLDPNEIPLLKRATKGVKGIKLSNGSFVIDAVLLDDDTNVNVNDKNYNLNKNVSRSKRMTKGVKIK